MIQLKEMKTSGVSFSYHQDYYIGSSRLYYIESEKIDEETRVKKKKEDVLLDRSTNIAPVLFNLIVTLR